MAAMMQAFYWDCPREEGLEFGWWNHVRDKIPTLAQIGFDTLWLPPAHKAANLAGPSMGYDPYDYYDLGEFDQKGTIPTWFGSRQDLLGLIQVAHAHDMAVLADLVINHNSGADASEINGINGQTRWTRFQPRSGLFPRDWECFHPNQFESWDEGTFGDIPDLSHRNPYVFGEILKLTRWLVETIGFDGFRYDFVKGYGAWTVASIQEYRYLRDGKPFRPYGVAEHWATARAIESWVDVTNFSTQNPVDAFDFPLREMLKALCDQYGFSLRNLVTWDTLLRDQPQTSVSFVENHDMRDPGRPIADDKLLAYSFILTHEGYPCVFWKDYYNGGLALEATPNGIAALVRAHRKYAGGRTEVLWADDDLYLMQRDGYTGQPGLVYALNNRGDRWNGARVTTRWPDAEFTPVAWWGRTDLSQPKAQRSQSDGSAEFWAPPRGYVVYGCGSQSGATLLP
jgi:alpha-amylase